MTPTATLEQAIQYHQAGALSQAEYLYRQILQSNPNDADAMHLLGVVAYQVGQPQEAMPYLQRAVEQRPGEAHFHVNLGLAYRALGRLDEALASYRLALRLNPRVGGAWNNIGNIFRDQNKLDEAAQSYRQALEVQPDLAEAHNNLGTIFHAQQQLDDAAPCYREALRLQPAYAQAHTNLGNTLVQQRKLDEAAACHRQALRLQPNFADAHINLGGVLYAKGELEEAIACYRQALQLKPQSAAAYVSLGAALAAAERLDEAITCYQQVLRLQPDFAPAHHNLGAVLRDRGKHDEAIACQRQAIRLQPDYGEAHAHLGHALIDQLKMEEALASYEQALRLKPSTALRIHAATVVPQLYRSKDDLLFWRQRVTEEVKKLREEGVALDLTGQTASAPFFLAYQGMNDRDLQREIAQLHRAPQEEPPAGGSDSPKIRVGFISRYFKNHTIGRLMRGTIATLSRKSFNVSVLSVGNHTDSQAKWIRQHADEFVQVPFSLPAARRVIAQQRLDVLFYTDLGMDSFTYSLAFSRLAPVQCVTWGHPVTSGIGTVDYFISSEHLESDEWESQYTEKLVRLKNPAIYYYRPMAPSPLAARATFGLPETVTLYGCPQSLFKFHPEFDEILGGILRQDPQGTLVLVQGEHSHWEQILRQRFAATMPDVLERVRFLPYQEHDRFLNLNAVVDVLLDPIHYGGGNTSYEGLALGVPIVTLPSSLLRARITHMLYRQMGVLDCVVHSAQEYVERAVRLGTDADFSAEVRAKIRGNSDLLYENKKGVQELEQFLEEAVAQTRKHRE
jgi:protein O-GlcNAc transferase